jgi:CP family cyanate transporter-like MFS transporter
MPLRSPAAWALTAFMGGLSIIYIVTLAWLAPLYHTHGYTSARSGVILSFFAGAQIVTGVLVPPLAHRRGDRRVWLACSLGAVGIGSLGTALAPLAAPAGWAIVGGLGMGAAFPLTLSLFVERARHPEEASGLTAMGFGGGYVLASAGPALAGGVGDLTGSLAAPFAVIGAIALVMAGVSPALVGSARPQSGGTR